MCFYCVCYNSPACKMLSVFFIWLHFGWCYFSVLCWCWKENNISIVQHEQLSVAELVPLSTVAVVCSRVGAALYSASPYA
jgi:hypothetical protein